MKIVIFGSIPPPIGGVTKSIENLLRSLKAKAINVELFSKKSLFKRYDIAHIHYSKSWKRLLGILLGKIMAKKVIFTLHGNAYKDDIYNTLSAKLVDGVILLNETTECKYAYKFKNVTVLGSIFAEGIDKVNSNKQYLERIEGKTYLLIYAYDKVYQDSKDIYGVDFVLENHFNLEDKYILVLLDPKGAYKTEINNIGSSSLVYLDYEVDFVSLLSEIDIYIRPTTTDGSSVAVQEALLLGKNVLASDVVERPVEVTLFKSENFSDLQEELKNIKEDGGSFSPNSIKDYLAFCNKVLEK